LILPLMPKPCATVADLGCGTGSLAVLLASAGHEVHGLDFSGQMVEAAKAKAARVVRPAGRRSAARERPTGCG
jgi:2-polyprenyl-3-methyl-5-hydroxy-6-metoxy-1,4-benzoquinol methylase